MPVTFTLDVEDYVPEGGSARAPHTTRDILEFLDRHAARATFFVVGELAAEHPDLVKDIAAAGHELALHAYRHLPLTMLDREQLRSDARRGKELLEDLSGNPVVGFRAPTFSLISSTVWAADVLAELGFRYSSSVLPARSPLYGYPGQPRTPYRWPSGLLELPCPVTYLAGMQRLANPYLGGIYFRVLPWPAIAYGLAHALPGEVLWTYCHPYDFDPGEPFAKRPDLSTMKSRLQWWNRRGMFARVERLFAAQGAAGPLADRAAPLIG